MLIAARIVHDAERFLLRGQDAVRVAAMAQFVVFICKLMFFFAIHVQSNTLEDTYIIIRLIASS